MTIDASLDAARPLLAAKDYTLAYAELHKALPALSASGLDAALGHHLVLLADTALCLARPDLALLNLRTAQGALRAAGDAAAEGLTGRITALEGALEAPFASLEDELEWARDVVRRLVRRAARVAVLRKQLDPAQQFEFEIRAEELTLFLEGAYPADDELLLAERDLVALREWTARRWRVTPDGPFLVAAMRRFNVSGLAREVLLAALAPALWPDVQRAYVRLWGDYLKRQPDVAFLARLVGLNDAEEAEVLRALGHAEPLCAAGLLEVYPGDQAPAVPRLYHGVAVCDALVRFALGQPRVSELQPAGPVSDSGLPELYGQAAATLGSLLVASDARVCLHGPAGSGRRTLVRGVAEALGLPLLELHLAGLARQGFDALATRALRDARLVGGVLLVDATGAEAKTDDLVALLQPVLTAGRQNPARVVFVIEDALDLLAQALDRRHILRLGYPTVAEQEALWRHHLAAVDAWRPSVEALIHEVVARYPSLPDGVRRASMDAVDRARSQRGDQAEPGIGDLLWAAQNLTNTRILSIAERVPTTMTWEDLILPNETFVALNEIVTYFRYREHVFDQWGFKRKLPYGRALTSLFYGPPGTGKTMAAGILGREFGMPVFRVDLAAVVSKYIGETEKNLSRVFEEAEFARAVILFDEADSLFGKRTEVKSSVDRYANLEVNFLLQKIEAFDGVVILTTNLERGLDEAFKRRIRFKIPFPFPDAQHRLLLWQSMLPREARTDGDLGLAELARRYEMSGANIKNAVLRAAFLAAEEGGSIDAARMEQGALREYKEMGNLVREPTRDE